MPTQAEQVSAPRTADPVSTDLPEDIVCLLGKDPLATDLRKICAAWPKVHPPGKTIDYTALQSATQIGNLKPKVAQLLTLGLIHLDGTIHSFAAKALRQYVRNELQL